MSNNVRVLSMRGISKHEQKSKDELTLDLKQEQLLNATYSYISCRVSSVIILLNTQLPFSFFHLNIKRDDFQILPF